MAKLPPLLKLCLQRPSGESQDQFEINAGKNSSVLTTESSNSVAWHLSISTDAPPRTSLSSPLELNITVWKQLSREEPTQMHD